MSPSRALTKTTKKGSSGISHMYDTAVRYHEAGYTVASCTLRWKTETGKKDFNFPRAWKGCTKNNCLEDYVDDAHNGLAIVTGEMSDVIVIDCDRKQPDKDGVAKWNSMVDENGGLPGVMVAHSANSGVHIYFSLSKSKAAGLKNPRNRAGLNIDGKDYDIDVRGEGGIVLCPPTTYERGDYIWTTEFKPSSELPPCPPWLIARLNKGGAGKNSRIALVGHDDEEIHVSHGSYEQLKDDDQGPILKRIKTSLAMTGDIDSIYTQSIKRDGNIYYVFRVQGPRVCPYGVHHNGSNNFSVVQRGHDLLYRCHGTECSAKIPKIMTSMPFPEHIRNATAFPVDPQDQSVYEGLDLKQTSQKFRESDRGGAELFAKMYSVSQRIVYSERDFYIWNGKLWAKDDEGKRVATVMSHQLQGAFIRFTSRLSQAIHDETDEEEKRKLIALAPEKPVSWTTAKSVKQPLIFLKDGLCNPEFVNLLGSERDVLCCDNGVIDLRTGELQAHHPRFLCHTALVVQWRGLEFDTSEVDDFFADIFNGDADVIKYMRRLLGYGITGHTREEVMAIFYGAGGNGKGILNQMLQSLLKDYYCTMSKDCVIKNERGSAKNAATPHLAELRQKRIGVCDESEDQEKLDDASIKLATGGSGINCRLLYSNPITFTPSHLPVLMTNHKPILNVEDGGMLRRLITVPYANNYKPPEEFDANDPTHRLRDNTLKDRMMSAPVLEQFLVWLVRGSIEWYHAGGLGPKPPALDAAMREYVEENDILGQFVSQFCRRKRGARVETKLFKHQYETCMEVTVTSQALAKSMRARGFTRKQVMQDKVRQHVFEGVEIKDESE